MQMCVSNPEYPCRVLRNGVRHFRSRRLSSVHGALDTATLWRVEIRFGSEDEKQKTGGNKKEEDVSTHESMASLILNPVALRHCRRDISPRLRLGRPGAPWG